MEFLHKEKNRKKERKCKYENKNLLLVNTRTQKTVKNTKKLIKLIRRRILLKQLCTSLFLQNCNEVATKSQNKKRFASS